MEENKNNGTNPKSRVMTLTIKAVVLNGKNEVLLLKRSKNNKFSQGKFDLPGGHVEENESLKDSIWREIKEETGLDTVVGEIIDVVEFPKDSPLFREEKRGVRCICYSPDDEVRLSGEHESYEWVPIEKAPEKLSEKDGFENEKRNTIIKAQKYLELKNSLDGWKRCKADFENYKKRQAEERKEIFAFSNINLMTEILPVLDNFHSATGHIPEEQKETPWVTGIMYIQKQLEKVLLDNGVEEVKAAPGEDFDPRLHEAIKDSAQDGKEEIENETGLKIKKVLTKGYKMGGRVIRAARVTVG